MDQYERYLSEAVSNFTMFPNADTARDLVQTAMAQWSEAQIADDSLAVYLRQVADWLQSD